MDGAMCTRWWRVALIAGLLGLIQPSSSRGDIPDPRPCPDDADHAAAALLSIKAELNDPNDALRDWKADGPCPCPCNWKAVACFYITYDGGFVLHFHVAQLHLASLGLSGTLSPRIGNLTTLQMVHLQGNNISGPIPDSIGSLRMLRELDMSNNSLNGSIPSSLGNLKRLHYLKLNNNSLSGVIPDSLGTIDYLKILPPNSNSDGSTSALTPAGKLTSTVYLACDLSTFVSVRFTEIAPAADCTTKDG
ncbi:Protein NSP-INTERACTING KINASE 1 [Dichanthelium oligosanthes]|uniref:Protein NSP-INTERACTING KINASE 1 n=1 Tax=Dichanthelium oligosanthes TaxID=888268 RepID=A0A1E5W430_9POAL|nr:Protein NSP-INTERACTING KINASE 1 [Dichanthelium oligosanthes]